MSNRTRLVKLGEGRKVWGVWLSHCHVAHGKVTGCFVPCSPPSLHGDSESRWRSRCKAAILSVVCRSHDSHMTVTWQSHDNMIVNVLTYNVCPSCRSVNHVS